MPQNIGKQKALEYADLLVDDLETMICREFEIDIKEELVRQFAGLLKVIYVNHDGLLSHTGIEKMLKDRDYFEIERQSVANG